MANLVGYVPLGLLIGLAQIRNRWPAWSWPLTALLPVVFSLGVETLQVYLPMRVPSRPGPPSPARRIMVAMAAIEKAPLAMPSNTTFDCKDHRDW